MGEHSQETGYFRCKECNSAGNWETTTEFKMMLLTALLAPIMHETSNQFSLGEVQLYDGGVHHYATDAEEHLLRTMRDTGEDAFVWNRLGNLYLKGNRADLAVIAYERSITLDTF